MIFSRIQWRIAVPYIILILLLMTGLFLFQAQGLRQATTEGLVQTLSSEALLLADAFREPLLVEDGQEEIQRMTEHYAQLVDARITLVRSDGQVLSDSEEDPASMESHFARPEILQAQQSELGSRIRFSETIGYDMVYVAASVKSDSQSIAVVRVSVPLQQLENQIGRLRASLVGFALIASALALALAILVAERTVRPVRWLTDVVQRMSRGDLSARLLPTTRDEMGTLTHSFNQMANRLRSTIRDLDDERARLAIVLDNMADAVLITDDDGHVQLLNPAAARILGVNQEQALNHSLAQVIRHHEIIDIWSACREQGLDQIDLIEVGRDQLFLQIVVTRLVTSPQSQACLLILQDLTHVQRLETIRRDFISNISHELRTPLAALRALADTLRDGALEDPPAARRFLDRIDSEVDAMTQVTSELLELTRIESGQVPVQLASTSAADVLRPPAERFQLQAERAGIAYRVAIDDTLPRVLADPGRIQQVLTNLLSNALKFTEAGGQVSVSAAVSGDDIVVAVTDTGVGISEEDLPRIFERFYKTDRSRSRGGTGLGLAIAKHIVQAHDGRIWAESTEGRGSTFYFTLPIDPAGRMQP